MYVCEWSRYCLLNPAVPPITISSRILSNYDLSMPDASTYVPTSVGLHDQGMRVC